MFREMLVEQLIKHEGLRLYPYRDSVGMLTIGVGRNLSDVGISKKEALMLLENDIDKAIEAAKLVVDNFDRHNEARQMVLVNMAFNLGATRLRRFKKMLAALSIYNYVEAAREMLDSNWAEQVGNRASELSKIMDEGE
jgi:lysozyme